MLGSSMARPQRAGHRAGLTRLICLTICRPYSVKTLSLPHLATAQDYTARCSTTAMRYARRSFLENIPSDSACTPAPCRSLLPIPALEYLSQHLSDFSPWAYSDS